MKKEYIKPEMQVFRIESNARELLDSVVSVETNGLDIDPGEEFKLTDDDNVWTGSW